MSRIEEAVQYMVAVAIDNNHGYDQAHRNGPNFDCSSLVGTALNKAGFNVSPKSWTGNLRKQLLACGFKAIPVNDARKRGDIFLSEGHHVVMCTDSNNIVHASINENGTTRGGQSGDQTGNEICTRSFYTPSYGWDYHLRYDEPSVEKPVVKQEDTVVGEIKATKSAKKFDRFLADTYTVTASWLNVRHGAGITNRSMVKIPRGTEVKCYGFYTPVGITNWLYVQFIYGGVKYTGFCSSKYLAS